MIQISIYKPIFRLRTITKIAGLVLLIQNYVSAQNLTFTFDALNQGETVKNTGTDINFWDTSPWQNAKPANYYASYFPFVERVQIMAAIGGNDARDLFVDPQNFNTKTDYDFTKLNTACQNIVDQGLKPMISLSWVPQKLSSDPTLGVFGTNKRPPSDYNDWYNYVSACLQSLIAQFGTTEVSSWSWCVGVEFESRDWFYDGNSSGTTKVAFFKLYDYAVAALEAELGTNNVFVGAHSMTVSPGDWNELEFIDHCVSGTNYNTGGLGTQLDFYQISYYDSKANGFDETSFLNHSNFIKSYLNSMGLNNLPFGIGEGRVLNGWDNKPLIPREVLHPIQGSMDAKKIILMIENDIDWVSHWGCEASTSGGKPINLVGANAYQLAHKMTGGKVLGKSKIGWTTYFDNEVEGIAAYDETKNKLTVMVYNNNGDRNAITSETVHLKFINIDYATGTSVEMKSWVLDANNGNFWDEWYLAQTQNGLSDADFSWSRYSIGNMGSNALSLWNTNKSQYQPLSMMDSTLTTATLSNNTLEFDITLAHHGVTVYEISNVKLNTPSGISSTSKESPSIPTIYPNPFKHKITVDYTLKKESNVKISIVSTTGQLISVLANSLKTKGDYHEDFGTNELNLASGIYVIDININEKSYSRIAFKIDEN